MGRDGSVRGESLEGKPRLGPGKCTWAPLGAHGPRSHQAAAVEQMLKLLHPLAGQWSSSFRGHEAPKALAPAADS